MRIKRLPYRLTGYVFQADNKTLRLDLARLDDEQDLSFGVPIDLAFFIHMYCRCAFCKASIARDLARCTCNKLKYGHLAATFPVALYSSTFRPIRDREARRVLNQSRKHWIQDDGGTYTEEDIANLYRIQEGLCYFCGVGISATKGANYFHKDHYQALSDGGANDRFNIVLTCASCNRRKSNMHGDVFERRIRKTRDPALGQKLGRIRGKLTALLGKRPIYEQPNNDSIDEIRKLLGLNVRFPAARRK